MCLERCTNAVSSPFGVTGALAKCSTDVINIAGDEIKRNVLSDTLVLFKMNI